MCICACVILKYRSLMLLSCSTIFPLTTSRTLAAFYEAIYNYKTAGAHYCTCLYLELECCGHANCLCIPFSDREESNERKDKRITMVQYRKIVFGTTVL